MFLVWWPELVHYYVYHRSRIYFSSHSFFDKQKFVDATVNEMSMESEEWKVVDVIGHMNIETIFPIFILQMEIIIHTSFADVTQNKSIALGNIHFHTNRSGGIFSTKQKVNGMWKKSIKISLRNSKCAWAKNIYLFIFFFFWNEYRKA